MTDLTSSGDGEEKKSRLSIYIFGAIVVAILAALLVPKYAAQFELGDQRTTGSLPRRLRI